MGGFMSGFEGFALLGLMDCRPLLPHPSGGLQQGWLQIAARHIRPLARQQMRFRESGQILQWGEFS